MKEKDAMEKPLSGVGFRLMSLMFTIRDLIQPRADVLNEAEIKPGFTVLDFGCGPGGYLPPLVELVGPSGKIYALDMHPLAIHEIKEMANSNRYNNISPIQSDCRTGLQNMSVDTILLYDVFHDLDRPNEVLEELHRVLKADGTLSFSDHHMKEEQVFKQMTGSGIFRLVRRGRKTYTFAKAD
jgi:ubiquinone/menaquinone biosynthesis C-methylase UbiE